MSDLEYIEEKLTLTVAAAETGISIEKLSYAINQGLLEAIPYRTNDGRDVNLVIRGDVFALVGEPGFGDGERRTQMSDVPKAPRGQPAIHRPSYDDALVDALELVPVHLSANPAWTELECITTASQDTYEDAVYLGFTGDQMDWVKMVSSAYEGM